MNMKCSQKVHGVGIESQMEGKLAFVVYIPIFSNETLAALKCLFLAVLLV